MGPWNVTAWIPEIKDSSVLLTCRNHPDLCWCQKNLGYLGARSVFFFGWLVRKLDGRCTGGVKYDWATFHPETGEPARECDCPGSDLLIVFGDYRLDQGLVGPPDMTLHLPLDPALARYNH